jgi:hypothetical protein
VLEVSSTPAGIKGTDEMPAGNEGMPMCDGEDGSFF